MNIKNFFGSKSALLGAIMDRTIEVDFRSALEALRGKSLTRWQRSRIDVLRTHTPTVCVSFSEYKKWSAEWWTAVVKLEHPNMEDIYFGLIGWSNNHGRKATVIADGKLNMVEARLKERVEAKVEADYKLTNSIVNEVVGEYKELPPLPGTENLPKVTGLLDPDLDPVVAPAPSTAEPKEEAPSTVEALRAREKAPSRRNKADKKALMKDKLAKRKNRGGRW